MTYVKPDFHANGKRYARFGVCSPSSERIDKDLGSFDILIQISRAGTQP
jgi:hypothetical protein